MTTLPDITGRTAHADAPYGPDAITEPLTLQIAVARLSIPEATVHRWIDEMGLEKEIVRHGSRTVCHLPVDTLRRLQERKQQGRGKREEGRGNASRTDVGSTQLLDRPAAKRQTDSGTASQVSRGTGQAHGQESGVSSLFPLPSSLEQALRDAVARAEGLQAELDAYKQTRATTPAPGRSSPNKEAGAPAIARCGSASALTGGASTQTAGERVVAPLPTSIGPAARLAGRILYGAYWTVVRVLLPREISRYLLGLPKSAYIGWEDDAPAPKTGGRARSRSLA